MVGGKEDNSEINDMFRHDWVPSIVLQSQMDRFMATKYERFHRNVQNVVSHWKLSITGILLRNRIW